MSALARQILLESVLAPSILASLALLAAHRRHGAVVKSIVPALAVFLSVAITYILAFGPPDGSFAGARAKMPAIAVMGLIAGVALCLFPAKCKPALIALAVVIPIWIGLPALIRGEPATLLLFLPLTAGLLLLPLLSRAEADEARTWQVILLAVALGLAPVAIFAKAISFAQISLALGSGLFWCLLLGRQRDRIAALITAAIILLALITALLLYSEVSLSALAMLTSVVGAGALAQRGLRDERHRLALIHFLCFLSPALAFLIARIDAGPNSLY